VETLASSKLHDVLIVFEGRQRVLWSGPDTGDATLRGLWPTTEERGALHTRFEHELPTLVIVSRDTPHVPLLPEEADSAPEHLRPLIDRDGDLPELRIPLFDWLPEDLRERGMAFLATAEALQGSLPPALQPELLVDSDHGEAVRFAFLRKPLSESDLTRATSYLFTQHAPTTV
jgi:hypothetical protein